MGAGNVHGTLPPTNGRPELISAMQAQRGLSRASAYRQVQRALALGWLNETPDNKVVRKAHGTTTFREEPDLAEVE